MNRLLVFLGLSVVIFFHCTTAYGQKNEDDKLKSNAYFLTGIGGSYVNLIDQGISPLLYSGIGGSAILGHFLEKESIINTFTAKFDFNNPSSNISNAEMYTFRLEGHYQQYWKLGDEENKEWKIRPGFDLSAKWALRQHLNYTNNSQHIETRFSVAPAVMIARPFQLWDRDFEAGSLISIPMLTYATRPLFASTRFPASVNKEEVKFYDYLLGGDVLSFGNYFKVSAQYYLYYALKNGNGLRLDYFWGYERLRLQNPIQTGEHSITISTFFKI